MFQGSPSVVRLLSIFTLIAGFANCECFVVIDTKKMRKKQLQIRRQRQIQFKRQEERIISSLNLHTVCQVWAFRQRQRKMWQRQLQIKRQIYLHTGYRIMSSPGKKEDDWKNNGKTNTNRTNRLRQKPKCSPTVLPFWVPTDICLYKPLSSKDNSEWIASCSSLLRQIFLRPHKTCELKGQFKWTQGGS